MQKILIKIFFILLLLPSIAFSGTAYYIDCSEHASTDIGGVGTYADSFQSINDANDGPAGGWQTGDDLYFKVGTTCTAAEFLNITWAGSDTGADGIPDATWITVGAYTAEGAFVLGAETRPTIDGATTVPTPVSSNGLVQKVATSTDDDMYVYVKDIRLYRSGEFGFYFRRGLGVKIENCYIEDSRRNGFLSQTADQILVTKNYFTGNTQLNNPVKTNVNGGVVAQGRNEWGWCTDITFSYNHVWNNWSTEVMGMYYGIDGGVMEYNTVWDNYISQASMYFTGVKNSIFRYNLVYSTNLNTPGPGIFITNELEPTYVCYLEGNEIYGNLIANLEIGISLTGGQTDCLMTGMRVYNNTVVDCRNYNFYLGGIETGGSDNLVKNNISWIVASGGNHVYNCDQGRFTFDNNIFNGGTLPSGSCETGEINTDPALARASNWGSLPTGEVTGSEFELTENSPAVGTGIDLGTSLEYVLIPGDCDFTATPPECTAADADDYDWPIGAFLGGLTISAGYPTSLQECTSDPRAVTFGVTSSANATCRFSVKGVDTCATAYADLDEEFETTGATTAHSDTDETFACDNTDTLVVICNDGSYDSNCLEITVDVASAGGPPQPAPTGFGSGGNVSSGGGGNVTAGVQ